MLSIMGERERTQEYGNEIHCHVYTCNTHTLTMYIIITYRYIIHASIRMGWMGVKGENGF